MNLESRSKILAEKLGMSYGAANNRLRKSLLFKLASNLNLLVCFQCNKKIETIDSFSIEHKIPWQFSSNPKETFFDLSNIAFSHIGCNVAAGLRYKSSRPYYERHSESNIKAAERRKVDKIKYERMLKMKRERYHANKKK